MDEILKNIRARLFELQDLTYRDFQAKLMPTVDPGTIIGVRTPMLRQLAKEYAGRPESREFLKRLPHLYYEENNLHAFLLERIKDYDRAMEETEAFLPFIDNWATCDMLCPKVFGKHLPELLEKIRIWIRSSRTYTVRFGLGMLMRYYLDEAFKPKYLELAASVKSEEYYISMMAAWYFATALAKQYDAALPYLTLGRLEPGIHNRTIQKAVESRRITPEQKAFLRSLRIK